MLKILLVDDSEDSRVLIQAFLKRSPCAVEIAENGKVALERLNAGRYDLVLMDMQMPVMDGFAATRAIREREAGSGSRLPIFALSAYEREEELASMTASGCDGLLRKPIRKEELLNLLKPFLAGAQSQ